MAVPRPTSLQGQWYTLFGFSKELDWRPLHFVDSIPAHRICNACGVVPRVSVFLPCRHVLCNTCYEQCVCDKVQACPLDGDPFREEDVGWTDFPLENLLKRKVKCWNEDNGCEMDMAASEINKHFFEDCVHHSTRCPKCSALILRSKVCAHLRSDDCSTSTTHSMAENLTPHDTSSREAMLATFETILEKHVAEVRAGFHQVVRDISQCDKLNELSHSMNVLRETVMQSSETQALATSESVIATVMQVNEVKVALDEKLNQISQRVNAVNKKVGEASEHATKKCLEKLDINSAALVRHISRDSDLLKMVSQSVSAFERALGKALERATDTICQKITENADRIAASKCKATECVTEVQKDRLLGYNTLNVTRYEFCVKELKSLRENANMHGWATYFSDPVYLCGYCISPGVYLKKNDSSLSVHALMQLNKGVIDEFLQWPFNHEVKVTFVDSSQGRHREFSKSLGGKPDREFCGRPTESSILSTFLPEGCDIEDLERGSYIIGDEFCVRWELLRPNLE